MSSSKAPKDLYDTQFYAAQIEGSSQSAGVIVPEIMSIFPSIRSVVDVGCGTGVWLNHFKMSGVETVLGIDGGGAKEQFLAIDLSEFISADLTQKITNTERYDICISLEVAEHLPEQFARQFVENLCSLSDVVIFGAAVPGQGGHHHVNEQWQSYWISLFDSQGYRCYDILRPIIWNNPDVEWWYAQNILIFVTRSAPSAIEGIERRSVGSNGLLDVVHPRSFQSSRAKVEKARARRERNGRVASLVRKSARGIRLAANTLWWALPLRLSSKLRQRRNQHRSAAKV